MGFTKFLKPLLRGVSTSALTGNAKGSAQVSAIYKEFQALQKAFGIKMAGIEIRRLKRNEVDDVATYANSEGWNISLQYLQSCYDVPSTDWWGAVKDGRLIGSIARHDFDNQPTSMIGLYVVDKPYRNQGIGLKLLTSLLSPVRANNFLFAAADPTLYANITCKPSYRIYTAKGRKHKVMMPSRANGTFRVVPLRYVPLLRVEEYDAKIHPLKRTAFFRNVIIGSAVSVFVALDHRDEVIGYGILRRAAKGWRFCPIYAETDDVGHELFRTLLEQVPEGDEISMNLFESNHMAITMVEDSGFTHHNFATLMHTGDLFTVPVKNMYSCATVEFTPY